MGFMDKVKSFLSSEGNDLKEGMDSLKNKMDDELTRRERELAASPSERMEMMQDEIAATDARFDELSSEVADKTAGVDAKVEVAEAAAASPDQPAPLTTADLLDDDGELDTPAPASTGPSTDAAAGAAPTDGAAAESSDAAWKRPAVPARMIGTKNRTPFLVKDDVAQPEHFDQAMTWVTAQLVEEGMPEWGYFDHAVAVSPDTDDVNTSDAAMQQVVDQVAGYALVKEGKYGGSRLLYFYAPGLAPEDLHLLTASALATSVAAAGPASTNASTPAAADDPVDPVDPIEPADSTDPADSPDPKMNET